MVRANLRYLVLPALVLACGDSGGSSASNGATDGGTSSATDTAAETTAGGASVSDSATEPTGGGMSLSDSQTSQTAPTEMGSNADATSDATDTAAIDTTTGAASIGDTTTGGVQTSASGPGTGMDTGAADTGTGTDAGTGTTGPGEPLVCDAPPPGFDGVSDPTCEIAPQVGMFTPLVEWSKSTWSVAPTYVQVMAAPIVVSLTDDDMNGKIDGDDVPDIVFNTFAGGGYTAAGWLRAVSGKDGAEILNIGGQGITGSGGIAGGDIDGDGIVELVTVTTSKTVKAFEHDGTLKWTSVVLNMNSLQNPAIADMDGDGAPEILAGPNILDADGSLRATVAHGAGRLISVAADMDDDGTQELIGGNAIYDIDGNAAFYNGLSDGWVGVADVDQDQQPDIVVVDPGAGKVRLQDRDGVVLWEKVFPGGGGGPPTIADYDGDGEPEIGVAGKTGYVVFEGDGATLWQKATQDASSAQTGSSVYDFEGDGAADVVYNDEVRLRVYAGSDGTEKLNILGHGSGTVYEYPIVVDVDSDGQAEIVVTNNNYAYGTKAGVTVYGDKNSSWRPGRKIWNQHAYSITNSIRVS